MIYRDDKNLINQRILEVIFEEEDVKNKKPNLYKTATFSGKIILYDDNLIMIGGREYENGKLTAIITRTEGVKKPAATQIAVSGIYQVCSTQWIAPNDGYYMPGCECTGYTIQICTYISDYVIPLLDPIDEGDDGGGSPGMGGDFYGTTGGITTEEAEAYVKGRSIVFISTALADVDLEFNITPFLSDIEKASLYDRIYYSYRMQFSGNFFTSVESSVNNSTFSDDDPFLTWLKQKYRKWIGIDKPLNAQEATELANELSGWGEVGQKIIDYLQTAASIYGFLPGYSALNNLLIGDYGSAAADASFDLFGAGVFKYATTGILSIGSKYSIKVAELASTYPNIAGALKDFAITEVKILKRSNTNNVIIIGERMDKRVLPSKTIFDKIFKQEISRFEPSQAVQDAFDAQKLFIEQNYGRKMTLAEVQATQLYQANEA